MAAIRHLARAPITEAIVDFRVTAPPDFRSETLASARERLHGRYPTVEEQRVFEAGFEFAEGKVVPVPPAATQPSGFRGYLFKSEDGKDIAQFRVDGFTYNRLAPYTSWDDIRPEALRLWELYREVARPERLDRLALRYINRLEIPPRGELPTFLQVMPPLVPGAPPYLATFLMRLISHDPSTGYLANVTEALERGVDPTHAIVILDVDVYTLTGLELSSDGLLSVLERLHQMKNEIFFGCITEETARLHGG